MPAKGVKVSKKATSKRKRQHTLAQVVDSTNLSARHCEHVCNNMRAQFLSALKHFTAGSLKLHLNFWKTLTSDSWVLQTIQGCVVEFDGVPVQQQAPAEINFSESEMHTIDMELAKLVTKGVIESCGLEQGDFLSNIFIRPKRDGWFRLILNLCSLNQAVSYHYFKMESLHSAVSLMTPNCYMASLDLKDAYYSVPVAEHCQRFLKFRWRGQTFVYVCLPNGLACAPRVFTKIMKPLYSILRQRGHLLSGYIDDLFLQGAGDDPDLTMCTENIVDTVDVVTKAGLTIHPEKLVLTPTQVLPHLGFILNSVKMCVFLTAEIAQKLKDACVHILRKPEFTLQELAEVIGVMVASFPGIMYGIFSYHSLDNAKTEAVLSIGQF